MRLLNSREYAEIIRATNTDANDLISTAKLDEIYQLGVKHAVMHYTELYEKLKNNSSESTDGLSFEVLDFLFKTCKNYLLKEN